MVGKRVFGNFEGRDVTCATIDGPGGLHTEILDYGATLRSLVLSDPHGGERNVVLGLDNFADYPICPYFGATVGRFGNRIGEATFSLDGQSFKLDANQDDRHHLHGGAGGLTKRIWSMSDPGDGSLRFETHSKAGEQGYPGDLEASCTYRLTEPATLRIEMMANVSEACPINMVHHTYWNLDGGGKIDGHQLQLQADDYLPTGEGQVPTGERLSVERTPYDFRKLQRLDTYGDPLIDFCFPIRGDDPFNLRPHATLVSGDGRLQMTLSANQPAVQVYTGWKLDLTTQEGRPIGPRSGICLETEAFPDAPNKPQFPSAILQPGEVYRHVMEHKFTWA